MLFSPNLISTEMQSFLNKEAAYFNGQYRKYPALWLVSFLYISLCATLLSLVFLCNIPYPCSYNQQGAILWFGTMLSFLLIPFVILPNLLRFILNCLYVKRQFSKEKKMSPLHMSKQRKFNRQICSVKSFRHV